MALRALLEGLVLGSPATKHDHHASCRPFTTHLQAKQQTPKKSVATPSVSAGLCRMVDAWQGATLSHDGHLWTRSQETSSELRVRVVAGASA